MPRSLRLFVPLLGALACTLATPSTVSAQAMVICHMGGPGTTAQAQDAVNKFLRHIEKTVGVKANSMTGEYHTTMRGCLGYVAKKKPVFGVFDLPTYLKQKAAWKISPLGHLDKGDSQRYYVLVREGTVANLAALKGKSLISTVKDLTFVSRVILGGKLDVAKDCLVKTTRRPLKGIRKVARGRADATVVDAMAHAHLKELKLPVKLKAIYTSPGLPGLTLAVLQVNKGGAGKTIAKITKVQSRLCIGEGKALCKSFSVKAFHKAKSAIYRKLEKQYRGK